MNCSLVSTLDEALIQLKGLYLTSRKCLGTYKDSTYKDKEEAISKNYLGLDVCYLNIHSLNVVESFFNANNYNKDKHFNRIQESRANFEECLSIIKGNLAKLAIVSKPDSYLKDEEELDNLLKFNNKVSYIYPDEGKILISTIYNLDDKNIIFSTSYSEQGILKYLTINKDNNPLPGKFSLGKDCTSNPALYLQSILNPDTKLEDYIITSRFDNPYLIIQPKENISIKQLMDNITDYLTPLIQESKIVNGNILLRFNNLIKRKDFFKIVSFLKVKPNDIYNFLAAQEDF